MAERKGRLLHQQALTALGFFMGLTLTARVLIPNPPNSFRVPLGPLSGELYFEFHVTYDATVGAVSSVGLLAFLEPGGGLAERGRFADGLGTGWFFLSVFGLLGGLPPLLVPFTRWGAEAVPLLETTRLTVYFVGGWVSARRRAAGSTPPR